MKREDALPLVVVQNNFVTRLTGPAAEATRTMGMALHDVSSGDDAAGARPLPAGGPWGPILTIGSVLFVHQWARNDPQLARWVFWNDQRYDAATWADILGDDYLNAGGEPTTVGGFQSSTAPARHIRPRSGIKMIGERVPSEDASGPYSVSGLVATPGELAAVGIDPSTPIWTAAPRRIDAEVRVWMIGGRPAAASTYRVDGGHLRTLDHPFIDDAVAMALRIHDVWSPDRHYVVDIAATQDGPKVIEYNPIHSSGWYAADPRIVIRTFMEAETMRTNESSPS